MRYVYPVVIEEAEDGVTVTFPDVPEAITTGATREEALAQAPDALVTGLSFYVDEGQPIPTPSVLEGSSVAVPALEAAKLALHETMLAAGLTKTALAQRLGVDEKAVRRLLDVLHGSKIEQVEAALLALGKRIEIGVMAIT
jgi:antitoxin HicB